MGTVPSPYSPTAGDDATQARVLTWADAAAYLLGSSTSGGSRRPLCVMRQVVGQSIATGGTGTAVNFDTEDVDYDNGHSTVTNISRYTAATAGWYDVKFLLSIGASNVGDRRAWLRTNGATNLNASEVGGLLPSLNFSAGLAGSRLVFLNVADYIELMAYQSTGGALSTTTGQESSYMSVEWRSN